MRVRELYHELLEQQPHLFTDTGFARTYNLRIREYFPDHMDHINTLLEPVNLTGRRVMDVGCGTGLSTVALAKAGADVRGVDSAAAMLAVAQRDFPQIAWDQSDAEDLPDQKVDVVVACHAFHYFDPHSFVRSAGRICEELVFNAQHMGPAYAVLFDALGYAIDLHVEGEDFFAGLAAEGGFRLTGYVEQPIYVSERSKTIMYDNIVGVLREQKQSVAEVRGIDRYVYMVRQ